MTVTPEQIAAYADGELSEIEARRVARAVAADPALGQQLAAEHRLRATLAARFAPVAEAPVPERFTRLIAEDAKIVSFAEAQAARAPRGGQQNLRWGGAIAAALVAGVALGSFIPSSFIPSGAPVDSRGGTLVASANLARALETQASDAVGETRLLVTFRDGGNRWCRGFETAALSGIACRDGRRWQLERTRAIGPTSATQYRQAGSGTTMATAQDMAVGAPLDAAAEQVLIANGWDRKSAR